MHLSNFSLIGVQADQMVLRGLVPSCLPEVDTLMQVSLLWNYKFPRNPSKISYDRIICSENLN